MIRFKSNREILKDIFAYTVAVILCLLILIWVMELWNADLNIPFKYSDDALWSSMSIKGVIDNGWYLHNNFVGMPSGLDSHDFPTTENLQFLMIRIISIFSSDFAYVMNLYFLLTFPLTTMTSLFVFRKFNFSYAPSIVMSLLYSFIPYHFIRGEQHLFLASYYMIPLIVMVILWVYSEDNLLYSHDQSKDSIKFEFGFKSLASIIICLLVASTGIYYAAFACIFLFIAGLQGLLIKRKYSLLVAETFIAIIIFGSLVNVLPNIVYYYNNGMNNETVQRHPVEAEFFALKIDQLLMPVDGHRLDFLADMKEEYNDLAVLVNENRSSTLGFIGSIGFLFLISRIFYKPIINRDKGLCDYLSILNISAVLLATIGGFGFFLAIVCPGIRSYNRISVYIAFFSLFAVNILLESLFRKHIKTKATKLIYFGLLGLILVIGILDQTNKSFVPQYDKIKTEYSSDREFVNIVETSIPANSMIFQLPYVSFPENLAMYKMGDYQLFRGYLHSNDLRWSYGTMKNRRGDLWQREVVKKPLNEFLENISLAGFYGIYIDRRGYNDKGTEIEAGLKSLLEIEPIISEDNNLVYFNMNEYNNKLK